MSEYTVTFNLTAAGCNAQMQLPLQSLVRDIIDAATLHANSLGFGYARLIEDGNAWVLSRLSMQISRFPTVGESYSLTTWIEGFNRHFSERNFEIIDAAGTTIGYARTIWVAINIATRRPADLSALTGLSGSVSQRPCPIPRQGKIKLPESFPNTTDYTVCVSDIDSNRHLTTARYVELVVNTLSLETCDRNQITEFEISFMHECHFGETLTISSLFSDNTLVAVIADAQGIPCCNAKITLSPVNL
ncbi:MAG: acyl-[acyl-carrier-protein] thioesterase [Paramuribaculum sp.]|nr:acyl-[acyl-carrier-protein] thioesterase [Paramuribaculum sp.]